MNKYTKYLSFSMLFLVILLGGLLRFKGTFEGSFAFTYDAGRDLLAMREITFTHKMPLIGPTTGLTGFFYGPWWYWLLLIIFIFLRGDPMLLTSFVALTSLLGATVGYFIGKKLGGKACGILFAGLVSFSAPIVATSDQIWSPNLIPFFLILYFLSFILLLERKTKKSAMIWALVCGFGLGILLDMEIVFALPLLIAQLLVFILFTFRQDIKKEDFISFIVGFLLTLLPRIFFDLRHGFIMTKALLSVFRSPPTANSISFLPTFTSRIQVLYDLWNRSIAANSVFLGLFAILGTFLAIYFYREYMTLIKKLCLISLLITVMTYVFMLTFFKHDIYDHYIVGLPIIFMFYLTTALSLIPTRKRTTIMISIFIFAILLLNFNPTKIFRELRESQIPGDASYYRNQTKVVDFVYKEAMGKPFKEIAYSPAVYDYPYQYLFAWYGPKNYGYKPSQKADVAFFILEPERKGYEFRLEKWLKERDGDGKTVSEKIVAGGIRVQKRIYEK